MFDDEDFLNSEEVEQLDYDTYSQSKNDNSAYQRGKQRGKELSEKTRNIVNDLKSDDSKLKSSVEDIKSGNYRDAISKIGDVGSNKNSVERVGESLKNTGKGMKKASDISEKSGQGFKNANKTAERLNDAVSKGAKNVKKGADVAKKGAQAAKTGGKTLETAGEVKKGAGQIGSAVSDAVNVAGAAADATVVGAPAGVAVNTAATIGKGVSKAVENVGTAEKVAGQGVQTAATGAQAGLEGVKAGAGAVEKGADAGKLANKVGEKFGDAAKNAGNLGKNLEELGEKIENTGQELGDLLKPFAGILGLIKRVPSIIAIAVLIVFILMITNSYYDTLSPLTESSEKFNNILNGGTIGDMTSGLYNSANGEDNNNEKFYKELEKWYNKSNGQLDVPLVLSTLFYTDMTSKNSDFSLYDSSDDSDSDNSDIDSDNESTTITEKGKIKRLRKICKNMLDSKNNPVSDEDYKNFLKTKYINKQSEFKQFFDGLDDKSKENKIDSIIGEIYQYREYFVQVFGDGKTTAYSESYENSCVGAIDKKLVDDLHLPIESNGTITFDSGSSYGLIDGKIHNGVDLNQTTAGVSQGSKVYSIHDGTVVDEGVEAEDSNSTTNLNNENKDFGGIWIKIKHEVMVNEKKYVFYSVYKHLSYDVKVKKDDKVEKGQEIGYIGKEEEGGAQLHFEFRNEKDEAIDPTNLFIKCVYDNSVLVGNTDEEKIWNHFIGAGYSKASTASAMGNMISESGLVSYRVQGDFSDGYTVSIEYTNKVNNGAISEYDFVHHGPGGGGYGLIQWTSYDRKQELYNRTIKNGLGIDDLKTQLDYEQYELGLTGSAGWLTYTQKKLQWESATESTVKSAAIAYCEGFERPQEGNCNSTRENNAQYIYDKYKNYIAPASKTVKGIPGIVDTNNTGDGYPDGTYTSTINSNQFKNYKQYLGSYAFKSYWNGTMKNSGCGPTSVAILASGVLDFNIAPYDIAQEMDEKYGTTGSDSLKGELENLGLSPKLIHNPLPSDITDALNNGEVMLVSVDKRTIFPSTKSHIMAIVDINSSGQVYVMNPGSNLEGWYDLTEITKGCQYIITVPAK